MRRHPSELLLVIIAAIWLAACGSDPVADAGLTDPGLSNVKTDNGAARSAAITPDDGGTITATGSNGAIYTLMVPPDAIDSNVQIAIYPVSSITGYPLAGNVKAGVHLGPEGLTLLAPVSLTIELPNDPDAKSIAAIASGKNAEGFHAYPALVEGRKITFTITHFSQYTIGDATLQTLIDMPTDNVGSRGF